MNGIWVRALPGPMHLDLKQSLFAPQCNTRLQQPWSFTEVPDSPALCFLIPSGSKKKEHKCARLSEAKASHSHKMWTEASCSVPHFLQVGLLLSPITYKCLLKVLCPVSRPITTLDCVLLKDSNWAFVASLGPEINSQACSCVPQGPPHNTKWWLSIQCFTRV
jgi:hypothetical protein